MDRCVKGDDSQDENWRGKEAALLRDRAKTVQAERQYVKPAGRREEGKPNWIGRWFRRNGNKCTC